MPDELPFEDLCRDCGYDDEKQFMRLLRNRGFPTNELSRRRPVKKRLANQIARAFIGRDIDWYPYEQRERDRIEGGPLEQLTAEKMEQLGTDFSALVNEWFTRLGYQEVPLVPSQDCILGVACAGGYLRGDEDDVFTLPLGRGMNVLIGPRGSGKSTILNYLGVTANSMTAKTSVLVEAVVAALSGEGQDLPSVARRIREVMKSYDTNVLALYCASSGKVYCLLADLARSVYGVLEYREGQHGSGRWVPTQRSPETVLPSLLFFKQGEVVRIADADNPHYLNNVLDTLYPELQQERTKLARHLTSLLTQYGQYKMSGQLQRDEQVSVVAESARVYLSERRQELDLVIRAESDSETLSASSHVLIESYVSSARPYRSALADTPVRVLLEEEAYDALYVGRILGFLRGALQTDKPGGVEEPEAATSAEVKEDAAEPPQPKPGEADIKRPTPAEVAKLLQIRLQSFLSWLNVYGSQRVACTERLEALAVSYRSLLQKRLELLEKQQKACKEVDSLINRINVHGRETEVHTPRAEELSIEDRRSIEDLEDPRRTYGRLMEIKVRDSAKDARELAEKYDRSINKMLRELDYLSGNEQAQKDFVFHPISIRFLLNNRFMDFYKLSFGQKSGLILNIVLSVSKAKVFLLDQPEDHLDALGINKMLVPMMSKLASSSQVIVASHSLSLVLGADLPTIAVLEPCGVYGRLQLAGVPQQLRVLKAMLEVLEGGEETFATKLEAFEQFLNRAEAVRDTEIGMIESSFRRRTIEELRSALQPVICDRFLLDSFRHDLKNILMTRQSDVAGALDHQIRGLREAIRAGADGGTPGLARQVELLLDQLDSHIRHLDRAIDDIRMLDTQPQKRAINCYETLASLRNSFLQLPQLRDRRMEFELDERLKGKYVLADPQHLLLVFRNLLYNSLRATENRFRARVLERARARRSDRGLESDPVPFTERISILYESENERTIYLLYQDNGCGIPEAVANRLYVERCTTHPQKGDHGWGGVIIKKLLELNGGDIVIVEAVTDDESRMGTKQRISLTCTDPEE